MNHALGIYPLRSLLVCLIASDQTVSTRWCAVPLTFLGASKSPRRRCIVRIRIVGCVVVQQVQLCLDQTSLDVCIAACIHLLPSHAIHSVVLVLLITALQPMYLCSPTNTPEVIRAIGNSEKLVHVFVAAAVVITVRRLAATLQDPTQHSKTYS